jgi:hypothetical protein
LPEPTTPISIGVADTNSTLLVLAAWIVTSTLPVTTSGEVPAEALIMISPVTVALAVNVACATPFTVEAVASMVPAPEGPANIEKDTTVPSLPGFKRFVTVA